MLSVKILQILVLVHCILCAMYLLYCELASGSYWVYSTEA